MFLDLRILNELRVNFSQVRILNGLWLEWRWVVRRRRRGGVSEAFELIVEIT